VLVEAALRAVKGKIEDKDGFMKALKNPGTVRDARGDWRLDEYGNPVMPIYIRKVERRGRQAGERGGAHLPQREPVLEVRREAVPRQPGLLARLPAGEEPRALIDFDQSGSGPHLLLVTRC
jgi:hypothetical protein